MEEKAQTHWRSRSGSSSLRAGIVVAIATVAMALFPASSPLHADWLVTRSGSKIQTAGTWQVKGKLVVFKLPNGTLSSLKLTDVDLAKSREATTAAAKSAKTAAKPPATKPVRQKAVMTISDADVAHVEGNGGQGQDGAGSPAEASPKASKEPPTVTGGLEVGDWQPTNSDDGVGMTGTVHNPGNDTVAGISLEVRLYDRQGKLIATGDAAVAQPALPPHGATTFRVSFPSVFSFTTVKFAVKGTRLGTAKPAPAASPNPNPPAGSPDQG